MRVRRGRPEQGHPGLRFFYPTVSIMATWKGNLKGGCVPNAVFALLEGTPHDVERELAAVMARD